MSLSRNTQLSFTPNQASCQVSCPATKLAGQKGHLCSQCWLACWAQASWRPKCLGVGPATGWQLAGARGVWGGHTTNWLATGWSGAEAQPTGWQLAGLELRRNQLAGNWLADTAKQTLGWAIAILFA